MHDAFRRMLYSARASSTSAARSTEPKLKATPRASLTTTAAKQTSVDLLAGKERQEKDEGMSGDGTKESESMEHAVISTFDLFSIGGAFSDS